MDKKEYIKKTEYEITKNSKDSKRDKFARNDTMKKKIKNCRGVKKCNDGVDRLGKENQRESFRQLLELKENEVYLSKEYSMIKRIKTIFKKQTIIEQYREKKYFIDLVFPVHKLGIEIVTVIN